MIKIGLTGGIGSGKSTVSFMLKEAGFKTDSKNFLTITSSEWKKNFADKSNVNGIKFIYFTSSRK